MSSKAALTAFALALLVFAPLTVPVRAQSQLVTGSFDITVTDQAGTSVYTIQYSYPTQVTVGQSANLSVVLQIRSLTGLKLFVSAYNITALVGVNSGGFVASRTVGYYPASTDLGASGNLYPGGHWGPYNITLPIGNAPPAPGPGETVQGFLSIGLLTKVSTYEAIGAPAITESGSKVVGPLSVSNNSQLSTSNPLILVAVAAAVPIAVLVYFVFGRAKHRRTRTSAESQIRTQGQAEEA